MLCTAQCQMGWVGCICLDGTEANAARTLLSLLSGSCALTLDSGVAVASMLQSAIASATPSSSLVLAGTRLMQSLVAAVQNTSSEYTLSAVAAYLSSFGGGVSSLLSAGGLQQAAQEDASLRAAIAGLLATAEQLVMGLTRRVHIGNSSQPARLGLSAAAMFTSSRRLPRAAVGDGSGFVFPDAQDAQSSGALAAQNPVDRVTLLPSAMQAAGAAAGGAQGTGFVTAQATLYGAATSALLPASVTSGALSQTNSSSVSLFSRVLSVTLDPPVASGGGDLVEATFAFFAPLNQSNQTIHCSYLDTCAHLTVLLFINSREYS